MSYEGRSPAKRLFLKSQFMRSSDVDYEKQLKFDRILRRYISSEELHSDFPPNEILDAIPKTHKRKFEVALGIEQG